MRYRWCLLAVLWAATASGAADYVWWEGEAATDTNFPEKTWFSPQGNEAAKLSGGDWLTNDKGRKPGEGEAYARYRINVDADGEYALWCRKFWKHGSFKWRFDDQPWQHCGKGVALADSVPLRTHVSANWVYLGQVKLAKGKHDFELRLTVKEREGKVSGFDCFVLTPHLFVPNGKHKPGFRSGRADRGYFAWEPGVDTFGDDALLDLRRLNETEAGVNGFVRRDGEHLVLGDGKRVRFWAVNLSAENAGQNRQTVDYLARKLAKLGVNMVRYHSPLFEDAGDGEAIDAKRLDDLHYLIAAMRKQGIYTTVSFYFPLWFDVRDSQGIEGYGQNQKSFALIYFNPRMQAIHRAWLRQILTTPNPYTGRPLATEPALAMVELVNEDSLFFWTFAKKHIPPAQWRTLDAGFNAWLTKRYGSLGRAKRAWGGATDTAVLEAWHMTGAGLNQGGQAKRKRMADQVRYLAELQRGFYEGATRYVKTDLGYGGLVVAGNWHTADPKLLDAVERYTYTTADVIDHHGYFGGKHEGDGSAYSVRVGHTFRNNTTTLRPFKSPLRVRQVADYPQIVSELGWTNPNRYKAEGPVVSAAYGALQGIDGLYLFACHSNYVDDKQMHKFAWSSPAIAGSSPAAALMYRRGDVRESPPVVVERLSIDRVLALEGSAGGVPAFDALRQADVPEAHEHKPSIDDYRAMSFCVGKVQRAFDNPKAARGLADLKQFIDPAAKRVESVTGELKLDYAKGLLTIDTPRAQGAVGFLGKAGVIELTDVAIKQTNAFATVVVVSLDDKPIAESNKLLVQAMTHEQPYGFKVNGERITDMGGAPLGVEMIKLGLRLKGSRWANAKATPLDENGYAADKPVTVKRAADGGSVIIGLSPTSVYHVIER